MLSATIPHCPLRSCRFHVRVLVPCYKEELSVIAATVQAALDADLPPGARRTVYLCDDGNSPDKRAWINTKEDDGEDVQYVTGRVRLKGGAAGQLGV
jgi:endoglucanase